MYKEMTIPASRAPIGRQDATEGGAASASQKTLLEEDIAVHIFSTASTLLGVCLTVIGIIHLIVDHSKSKTLADGTMALASLSFLAACLLSYWALRTRHRQRMYHIEKTADAFFIGGLVLMTTASFIIAYVIL